MIPTYDKMSEGLLRGEWYKLVAYSPRESGFKSHRELRHELKFYLESKVKPQNKQELVDGIKAFWAERVTEEKFVKYIDHDLKKVVKVAFYVP